jgi:hypothetical protein
MKRRLIIVHFQIDKEKFINTTVPEVVTMIIYIYPKLENRQPPRRKVLINFNKKTCNFSYILYSIIATH